MNGSTLMNIVSMWIVQQPGCLYTSILISLNFIPSHYLGFDETKDFSLPIYLLLQCITAYAQTQIIMSLSIFLSIVIPSSKATFNIVTLSLISGIIFLWDPFDCVNCGQYLEWVIPFIAFLTPSNSPNLAYQMALNDKIGQGNALYQFLNEDFNHLYLWSLIIANMTIYFTLAVICDRKILNAENRRSVSKPTIEEEEQVPEPNFRN